MKEKPQKKKGKANKDRKYAIVKVWEWYKVSVMRRINSEVLLRIKTVKDVNN